MSTSFNPQDHLIALTVRLIGPSGDYYARLALDTGASSTLVSKQILALIGYDPDTIPKTVNFTTGSGVESASRVSVAKLEALEQERSAFSVVAHTLPQSAAIDGLLGLDFLRHHTLLLDFQVGEITLT